MNKKETLFAFDKIKIGQVGFRKTLIARFLGPIYEILDSFDLVLFDLIL